MILNLGKVTAETKQPQTPPQIVDNVVLQTKRKAS